MIVEIVAVYFFVGAPPILPEQLNVGAMCSTTCQVLILTGIEVEAGLCGSLSLAGMDPIFANVCPWHSRAKRLTGGDFPKPKAR